MCLAVPGKIISCSEGDGPMSRMGRVNFGGVVKEICLAYVPEAKIGDYVIVHVGFALSVIDEVEAKKTLEYFAEMGDLMDDSPPASITQPAHTPETAPRPPVALS